MGGMTPLTATATAREERAAGVDVENPCYFLVGNEMVQLLWKTVQ